MERRQCMATTGEFAEEGSHETSENEASEVFRSGKYTVISAYRGPTEPIVCSCPKHGAWVTTPEALLSPTASCPKCAAEEAEMASLAGFIEKLATANPSLEVLGRGKADPKKVSCRCTVCGHAWETVPYDLLHGHGCPACARKRQGNRRLTEEDFRKRLSKKNPTIIPVGQFKGTNEPVEVLCCNCGHSWSPIAQQLLRGRGCPACDGGRPKKEFMTTETFIAELQGISPSIEVLGEYVGGESKIAVRCEKCGHEWEPQASALLRGAGCPVCMKRVRMAQEEFERRVSEMLPDIEVIGEYTGARNRVKVRCRACGNEWEPQAGNLLYGHGCAKCARKKKV